MRVTRVPNSDRRSAAEAHGDTENPKCERRSSKCEVYKQQWFTATVIRVQIGNWAGPLRQSSSGNLSGALVVLGSSCFRSRHPRCAGFHSTSPRRPSSNFALRHSYFVFSVPQWLSLVPFSSQNSTQSFRSQRSLRPDFQSGDRLIRAHGTSV